MTFELTLRGYDGDTDDTDDLVKWVSSPSREVLDKWLSENNLNEHLLCPADEIGAEIGELDFADGVDVKLSGDGSEHFGMSVGGPRRWIKESKTALAKAA